MSDKFFRFLEGYHRLMKHLGHVVTWGGFILIVAVATWVQGFPLGFVLGIIMGSIFAFISWLGFRNSHKDAVEAREKFQAFSQGQKNVFKTSRQVNYATLGMVLVSLIALILIGSCQYYSCEDDLIRTRMFFIMIGCAIAVDQLFRKEWGKGKAAIVALVILLLVVMFLTGRVFAIW